MKKTMIFISSNNWTYCSSSLSPWPFFFASPYFLFLGLILSHWKELCPCAGKVWFKHIYFSILSTLNLKKMASDFFSRNISGKIMMGLFCGTCPALNQSLCPGGWNTLTRQAQLTCPPLGQGLEGRDEVLDTNKP